jgi:hypothetical protein
LNFQISLIFLIWKWRLNWKNRRCISNYVTFSGAGKCLKTGKQGLAGPPEAITLKIPTLSAPRATSREFFFRPSQRIAEKTGFYPKPNHEGARLAVAPARAAE